MKTLDVVQIFGNMKIDIGDNIDSSFFGFDFFAAGSAYKKKNRPGSIKIFFIKIEFKKAAA
ncbi:hypothetical protein [Chryseobacterium carnipullorum]|uniref:hypothetical protein n=1 Tax=Chryseobacterium carnipullorum TaxID=1124835 RepID=UPI001E3C8791|nr:hypothetical protein [Chryseobacterium carnipullorum]